MRWASLTTSDELPLEVEIEAEGKDWGKSYSEYIRVKLDEEATQVRIELQTKPEPVRKDIVVDGFPTWCKWLFNLVGVVVITFIVGKLFFLTPDPLIPTPVPLPTPELPNRIIDPLIPTPVPLPTSELPNQITQTPIAWSYATGRDISSVSLSSDGSYIVVGSENKVILLNRERELLWNFQTAFPVTDVSISTDANYIVVGTLQEGVISDGWLYLLNREGELLGDFETTGISSVSISPDGSYWAMTYQHGLGWWDKVILYSLVEGNWLWVHTVGGGNTGAVSVSAYGEYIAVSSGATGGDECEIRLYNKQGELLWKYEIPGRFLGRAHSIAISADGRYIVGYSGDTDPPFRSY